MYIRFGAGILLVVAIAVTGVAIEKEILSTKRELSHQAYREEVLLERHQRARTRVEEYIAPHQEKKILGQQRGTPGASRTAQHDTDSRIR